MPTIVHEVTASFDHGRSSPYSMASVEHGVARVFAAAANSGTTTTLAGATVTVRLVFTKVSQQGGPQQAYDACLLCVDRALTRVSPPIDPLQYLTATSPRLESDPFTLVFDVQPSRAFAQEYPWKATAGSSDCDNAVDHHRVDGELVGMDAYAQRDEATAASSRAEARREAREATEVTDALWEAAVTHKFSQLSAETVTRARRFHWRLAYWSAERFINEANWAKLPPGTKLTRTYSPLHKTVLDAALASTMESTKPGELERGVSRRGLADSAHLGVPRITHGDVRGIEFDGLVVAHTARYAYVAVPYVLNTSAGTAGDRRVLWTLVSRVPLPVFISAEGGDTTERSASPPRKRARAAADDDAVARGTHFYNTAEALLHDHKATLVELPNTAKRVVTLRVHRAHCKAGRENWEHLAPVQGELQESSTPSSAAPAEPVPATCPLRFSVWLEDAALVGFQTVAWAGKHVTDTNTLPDRLPPRAVAVDGEKEVSEADSSGARKAPARPFDGLNTFSDLLGALSDSCARYLQSSEKFLACAQAVAGGDVANTVPPQADVELPPTPAATTADADTASVDSTTAVAEDEEITRRTAARAVATAASANHADAESLWRRNAVRKALTFFAALADPTSVHFKKLRRHQLPPGAMQSPKIERWNDARGLRECCNIEFKYRLGKGGVVSSANVDRIRHTLAAMASTQGGVVLVGVTDRGELVGHQRGAVLSSLRTTGFCPAMVKDSVTVKEFRAPLETTETKATTHGEADTATTKRTMPVNWWKTATATSIGARGGAEASSPTQSTTAPLSGSDGGAKAQQDLVITVVTVQRGQAPFYTAARNAAPYVRTCASSTLMPMHTMAMRIFNHIAFTG